ncbi:hypothetical protein QQ045_021635 [Rhodiola kirilowii]
MAEKEICSCWVDRGLIPIYKFPEMVGIQTQWNNWEDVIQWQNNMQWRSKAEKLVVFVILTVATYETWKVQNYRIFREETTIKEQIWSFFLKILRMKMELIKKTKTGGLYV